MKSFDAKALIALVVILGCFSLLGIYVTEGRIPDAVIAAIVAGALSGVVNYFFGHLNGTLTGQLQASTLLSQAALTQLQPAPPPVRVTTPAEPPASGAAA